MMVRKILLVRVALAGICFGLGVTDETVIVWFKRATHQAEEAQAMASTTHTIPPCFLTRISSACTCPRS